MFARGAAGATSSHVPGVRTTTRGCQKLGSNPPTNAGRATPGPASARRGADCCGRCCGTPGARPLKRCKRGAFGVRGRLDRTQEVAGSSPASSIAWWSPFRLFDSRSRGRVVSDVVSRTKRCAEAEPRELGHAVGCARLVKAVRPGSGARMRTTHAPPCHRGDRRNCCGPLKRRQPSRNVFSGNLALRACFLVSPCASGSCA
jgi:hypothetical protein